jgi:hypothetical protein
MTPCGGVGSILLRADEQVAACQLLCAFLLKVEKKCTSSHTKIHLMKESNGANCKIHL